MSGGKEKKRSTKAQGWEEAGSEFYQERYPGDVENIHRDPSKLATLLPSKQRAGELLLFTIISLFGACAFNRTVFDDGIFIIRTLSNYKSIAINPIKVE
jgi:hypothetical protein